MTPVNVMIGGLTACCTFICAVDLFFYFLCRELHRLPCCCSLLPVYFSSVYLLLLGLHCLNLNSHTCGIAYDQKLHFNLRKKNYMKPLKGRGTETETFLINRSICAFISTLDSR